MASARDTGVVYVRLSEAEKEQLEVVCRAIGVSQNEYARTAILAAVNIDHIRYGGVIEEQRRLRDNDNEK